MIRTLFARIGEARNVFVEVVQAPMRIGAIELGDYLFQVDANRSFQINVGDEPDAKKEKDGARTPQEDAPEP